MIWLECFVLYDLKKIEDDLAWVFCAVWFKEDRGWRSTKYLRQYLRAMHKWDIDYIVIVLQHTWSVETNKILHFHTRDTNIIHQLQLYLVQPVTFHTRDTNTPTTTTTTPLASTTRDLQKEPNTPVEVEPVTCTTKNKRRSKTNS